MQRDLRRLLGRAKAKAGQGKQQSGLPVPRAQQGGSGSRLLLGLNAQLRRPDPPGAAQPGPASGQAPAAAPALEAAGCSDAGGERRQAGQQRTVQASGPASSSAAPAAQTSQPAAAPPPEGTEGTRQCPLCGQALPLGSFQAHVRQELALLAAEEFHDEDSFGDWEGGSSGAAQVRHYRAWGCSVSLL